MGQTLAGLTKNHYFCNPAMRQGRSSVGSERLSHIQEVIGSTPIVPTRSRRRNRPRLLRYGCQSCPFDQGLRSRPSIKPPICSGLLRRLAPVVTPPSHSSPAVTPLRSTPAVDQVHFEGLYQVHRPCLRSPSEPLWVYLVHPLKSHLVHLTMKATGFPCCQGRRRPVSPPATGFLRRQGRHDPSSPSGRNSGGTSGRIRPFYGPMGE